jgi:hypothetical protein
MVIMEISPLWIPIAGAIGGCLMIVAIVGIVFWFKAREKELQYHQDLRVKEMEHQRRMKELEIELEKTRAQNAASRAA